MSSRARRLTQAAAGIQPYDWSGTAQPPPPPPRAARQAAPQAPPAPAVDPAQVERDAFMKGYAQGERAGAEAAAARGEAVVRRLTETVDELRKLKADLVQKTERQVVQLALAIARRITRREISLDAELIVAMARVALDRLGAVSSATIRLHPDDYAAVMHGAQTGQPEGEATTIVADPLVRVAASCSRTSARRSTSAWTRRSVRSLLPSLGDNDDQPPRLRRRSRWAEPATAAISLDGYFDQLARTDPTPRQAVSARRRPAHRVHRPAGATGVTSAISPRAHGRPVPVEIVGFREGRLLSVPLGDTSGIRSPVTASRAAASRPCPPATRCSGA
ncbi:MAG: FliH/SctL family protein [Vicinamibacterales bacterium]